MPIVVEGLDELLKRLEDMPAKLGTKKNILVRSLRKGGEVIRERAEQLAPVDTGNLKESMMVTVSDQTADSAVAKIGPSRKGFYGQFPEFGTINMSADPFLRPAFDSQRDRAVKVIGDELAYQIEKELKG